ncbi:MAG TPA: sugar kinase [Planctomycetaceae bacterium]|nr:sugar kinase [Planctomycetaceae bacterium]
MRVVTFGEVMLRLAPEEFLRLRQALPGRLEATFGGGELNVAVSIAYQGGRAAFLTVLPDNTITDAFVQELRKLRVEDDLVTRSNTGRFGVYFVETGANQRGGSVEYDREGSSISLAQAPSYAWDRAFNDARWFHITGITPAISRPAAEAALASVRAAKERGLTVSCDLNFRKKLWRWRAGTPPVELARETMRELLRSADVVIANEEDAELSLGIAAGETNVEAGELHLAGFEQVARQIVAEFPGVRTVAITLRESLSASHNNWGAMALDAASDTAYFAPLDRHGRYRPYEIRNIVDRVGAGDSFAGALIYALTTRDLSAPETALRYATAASCLKHSIKGDFNYSTRGEIEALMHGSAAGRVQR